MEADTLLELTPELMRKQATITKVLHGHDGLTLVLLEHDDLPYSITIDTSHISLEEADTLAHRVPEWWTPAVDNLYIYEADQRR